MLTYTFRERDANYNDYVSYAGIDKKRKVFLCKDGVKENFRISRESFTLSVSSQRFAKSRKASYIGLGGILFGERHIQVDFTIQDEIELQFKCHNAREEKPFTFYYRVSK